MHSGSKFLFKVVGTLTVVTKLVTKSITIGASTLLVEYLCTKDYKTIVFLYTCRYFHCYLTRIPVCVNVTKLSTLLGKKQEEYRSLAWLVTKKKPLKHFTANSDGQ